MALVDYKIRSLLSRGNNTSVVVVTFYAGDITTEDEFDITTNKLIPVTRYRRSKVLEKREYLLSEVFPFSDLQKTLNNELVDYAFEKAVDTIVEQQDISVKKDTILYEQTVFDTSPE